jgi:NAD(P)-dependent dehydrogenase (short-subunit alcohol dehydrogenase family)
MLLPFKGAENRLTTLDMDIRDESAIQKASEQVQDKFGDKPLRLLINVSGMVGLQFSHILQCQA